MKVTLGGDRLGSGNKQKVELHGYGRSTHDLSYLWRSTMSPGTVVPFIHEIALPGDTFDFDLEADVKTHPTVGPLFGSYKQESQLFLCPLRLYNSWLHNNKLNIGRNMAQVKLPQITLQAQPIADVTLVPDIDNAQINPSSLLAHLGIRQIGLNQTLEQVPRQFLATGILMYWDCIKNFYANKQEEIGAVIHTGAGAMVDIDAIRRLNIIGGTIIPETPATGDVGLNSQDRIQLEYNGAGPIPDPSNYMILIENMGWVSFADLVTGIFIPAAGTMRGSYNYQKYGNLNAQQWRNRNATDGYNGAPGIETFPLTNIDEMRELILASAGNVVFDVAAIDLSPYKNLWDATEGIPNILSTQEGLALKCYLSDLFNNWLNTDWIDGVNGISEITKIDTTGDSFTLDALILNKKIYNLLNRIAISGGSLGDWLDAVYAHDTYRQAETPMYMGGLIKEVVFQEVISNSASEGDNPQPLATLGGRGVLSKKHKGGKITIKVDEPSIILGLTSITPRLDYSQGNKWDVHLKTMDDLHKPQMDGIGFQELITEQMHGLSTKWDGTEWVQRSAGKQTAWINYQTNVNVVRGNFAITTNERFMVLDRRYEIDNTGAITDLTTYIDPSKFNFIFAATAIDAQNFWVQIECNITARRKMSAQQIPNL